MFNTAAKLLYGLSAAALVFALGLQVAVDDPAGFVLLLGIFVAAFLAGLAVTGSGVRDRAPVYGPDAPPLQTVVVDVQLSPPSPWPLATAVAAGTLAVGVATGRVVVTVGVIACPDRSRRLVRPELAGGPELHGPGGSASASG